MLHVTFNKQKKSPKEIIAVICKNTKKLIGLFGFNGLFLEDVTSIGINAVSLSHSSSLRRGSAADEARSRRHNSSFNVLHGMVVINIWLNQPPYLERKDTFVVVFQTHVKILLKISLQPFLVGSLLTFSSCSNLVTASMSGAINLSFVHGLKFM